MCDSVKHLCRLMLSGLADVKLDPVELRQRPAAIGRKLRLSQQRQQPCLSRLTLHQAFHSRGSLCVSASCRARQRAGRGLVITESYAFGAEASVYDGARPAETILRECVIPAVGEDSETLSVGR